MDMRASVIFTVIFMFFALPIPLFAQEKPTVTIEITKEGFTPQTITINQNEAVLFKNTDLNAHWPASNIHPTHGIYPEFDPKNEIPPGGTWQFTFTRAGVWQFHDHLWPSSVGTITVTGSSNENVSLIVQASQKWEDFVLSLRVFANKAYFTVSPHALTKELENRNMQQIANKPDELTLRLKLIGSERYMQKLIKDSGGGYLVDCHQEAHQVGRIAYELYGAPVFRKGSFDCHSGFYHGAMEAMLKQNGTKDIAQQITSVCSTFKTDFGKFECLHGVGHGVMALADYDIPTSLETCNKLDSPYSRQSCYGGVFMENILTAEGKGATKGHTTPWVSTDPHYPCNAIDQTYAVQYACYQMQTSRMLDISNYQFPFVIAQCQLANDAMKDICFKSMGRDVAGQTLRDPQKISQLCSTVPPTFYNRCIEGALNVIIDFWGENVKQQPHALCNLIENEPFPKANLLGHLEVASSSLASSSQQAVKYSEPQNKESTLYCYQVVGQRLQNVFGNDIHKIEVLCQQAPEAYVHTCKKAAGIG